jgi:hypothetical protein
MIVRGLHLMNVVLRPRRGVPEAIPLPRQPLGRAVDRFEELAGLAVQLAADHDVPHLPAERPTQSARRIEDHLLLHGVDSAAVRQEATLQEAEKRKDGNIRGAETLLTAEFGRQRTGGFRLTESKSGRPVRQVQCVKSTPAV